jgi:hypothetical protein
LYTNNGLWPNDNYFKRWEIYNGDKDAETSTQPILGEIEDLQNFTTSLQAFKDGKEKDTSIFTSNNISRKWDITHLIARASLKQNRLGGGNLKKIFGSTDDDAKKRNIGSCNTMLLIKFDKIPTNNKEMVAGIDLPGFKEHLLVLKKNEASLVTTGYEYLRGVDDGITGRKIAEILEQRDDIYKTTFIVAQIYKRVKMDITGNITYLDLN